jgi:hypothetical protein
VLGKEWEVPASAVRLLGKQKFYYRIDKKFIQEVAVRLELKVYDVTEDSSCVVCLETKKDEDLIIISPCGHKCGCRACLEPCRTCPICRTGIVRLVHKSELE